MEKIKTHHRHNLSKEDVEAAIRKYFREVHDIDLSGSNVDVIPVYSQKEIHLGNDCNYVKVYDGVIVDVTEK